MNEQGYSLIEVLVVIAVIAIVAGVANFNLSSGNRVVTLDGAVEQLVTDIERAKLDAVNGVYLTSSTAPVSHGIHFDTATPNQYIVFSGSDDYVYDVSEELRIVSLPQGIEIEQAVYSKFDVAFELFTGDYYLGGYEAPQKISVDLRDTTTGDSETVTINEEGLIVFNQICGDGVVQVGEQCDDGNFASNDECSAGCRIEWCGDRIVQNQVRPRTADGSYMLPSDPSKLEQCDSPTNCSSTCQGVGGGGCSISPHTPPNDNSGAWLAYLLLSIPVILFFTKKRLSYANKRTLYGY